MFKIGLIFSPKKGVHTKKRGTYQIVDNPFLLAISKRDFFNLEIWIFFKLCILIVKIRRDFYNKIVSIC